MNLIEARNLGSDFGKSRCEDTSHNLREEIPKQPRCANNAGNSCLFEAFLDFVVWTGTTGESDAVMLESQLEFNGFQPLWCEPESNYDPSIMVMYAPLKSC